MIEIGQRVVCPPFGIGRVTGMQAALVEQIPSPCYVVGIEVAGLKIERRPDATFSLTDIQPGFQSIVPIAEAESVLQPIATPDAARDALARLTPRADLDYDGAPFPERLHRADRALRARSLDERIEFLRISLGKLLLGDAVPFGERKALHALERVVIGEIALALGEPADELLDRVRARFGTHVS